MIVASSWDDGRYQDKYVIDIYRRLGIPTTFFPVVFNPYLLPRYQGFDIGNHTRNHRPFPELSASEIIEEISYANHAIMEQLDYEAQGFAYPRGAGGFREAKILRPFFKYCRKMAIYQTWDVPRVYETEKQNPHLWMVDSCYDEPDLLLKTYEQKRKQKVFVFFGHSQRVDDWGAFEDVLKRMLDNGDQFMDMKELVEYLNLRPKETTHL